MRKGRTFRVVTTNSTQSIQSRVEPRIVITDHGRGVRLPRVIPAKPAQPQSRLHSVDIRAHNTVYSGAAPKIAILVHIYYDNLVGEMINYLSKFPYEFDLYISLASDAYPNLTRQVEDNIAAIKAAFPGAHTQVVPNKGKDIGGKLVLLKHIFEEEVSYDYLVFAHDKQSLHLGDRRSANRWRSELLSAVFSPDNVNRILAAFTQNPDIGMCGGRVIDGLMQSVISHNPGNYPLIKKTYESLFGSLPQTGAFIGGTMFWVRFNLFKEALTSHRIDVILSQLEPGNVREPSITHALERIFGIIVTAQQYKIGSL